LSHHGDELTDVRALDLVGAEYICDVIDDDADRLHGADQRHQFGVERRCNDSAAAIGQNQQRIGASERKDMQIAGEIGEACAVVFDDRLEPADDFTFLVFGVD
jgi:hypothetical protein